MMKLFGAFLSVVAAGKWEIPETWTYCEAREQVNPFSRWLSSARIVGGGDVKRDAWPFIVRLRIGRSGATCGGSLLDGKHVLTAAHCCHGAAPKDIIAHVNDYSRKVVDEGEKILKVTKIVEHLGFSFRHFQNDVCLLTLEEDVAEIIEHKYACLPPVDWEWPVMSKCYTAGWGMDHESFGKQVDILNSVNVEIFDDNYCVKEQDHHPETMICAGAIGGGRDACQGDSGGPLICEINGNAVLAGVTSWGIGCARAGNPGEWAKVSNFIDWINDNIGPLPPTSPPETTKTTTTSTTTTTTTTTTTKENTSQPEIASLQTSPKPLTTRTTLLSSPTPISLSSKPSLKPWEKVRARRYCAAPEGSEAGLINWTQVASFVGGDKETDAVLIGLNKCQKELKEKVMGKPSTSNPARVEELMNIAIKRQVCVRAIKRGHFDALPCKAECEEVLKAFKRKSEIIKVTGKEKKKLKDASTTFKIHSFSQSQLSSRLHNWQSDKLTDIGTGVNYDSDMDIFREQCRKFWASIAKDRVEKWDNDHQPYFASPRNDWPFINKITAGLRGAHGARMGLSNDSLTEKQKTIATSNSSLKSMKKLCFILAAIFPCFRKGNFIKIFLKEKMYFGIINKEQENFGYHGLIQFKLHDSFRRETQVGEQFQFQ
ncbi:Oidioi.mRNA.OKI2018_I69.chr2.g3956.t1.cds [Oikopleura dioica]|uniref:Oidioi.mRNA.OKI2018_I69.chr2.g3956.t1.cds n=1 Tax=Oikopleura dioica TaxID=34765 RepID=A0ABN7T2I5_OIKDI|nr:Oidioi.mRNA.OKI2018_I69.chr2.g3956.t1.cds [Oikopleura dioica]